MVNLKHIITNRNCPTLESCLRDDVEITKEYEEQKYGEFPPRYELFEEEDDPNVYKEDPILNKLFEHYQTFFEKGIDYMSNGIKMIVYPSGSMLWYFNEAFSLCTKLSIDPFPEQYFIDEYYKDIGGRSTQIERYFVLSIVYALLAVNGLVRRQHLKMIDVLYNFLSIGCPPSIMVKCMEFVTKTYEDNNAIWYKFQPTIDHFGYTRLKVEEGLSDDEEEIRDLLTRMRKKVCDNWLKYADKFNVNPRINPPEELLTKEALPYWTKLRNEGFIVANSYALAPGVSPYDATYIADQFGRVLRIENRWKIFENLWHMKNMAQKRNEYANQGKNVPSQKLIDEIFEVKPKELHKAS